MKRLGSHCYLCCGGTFIFPPLQHKSKPLYDDPPFPRAKFCMYPRHKHGIYVFMACALLGFQGQTWYGSAGVVHTQCLSKPSTQSDHLFPSWFASSPIMGRRYPNLLSNFLTRLSEMIHRTATWRYTGLATTIYFCFKGVTAKAWYAMLAMLWGPITEERWYTKEEL